VFDGFYFIFKKEFEMLTDKGREFRREYQREYMREWRKKNHEWQG